MEFMSCIESIGTNLVNSENSDNARRLRILIKKRIGDASDKLKLHQKGSVRREGGNEGGREGGKEGGWKGERGGREGRKDGGREKMRERGRDEGRERTRKGGR